MQLAHSAFQRLACRPLQALYQAFRLKQSLKRGCYIRPDAVAEPPAKQRLDREAVEQSRTAFHQRLNLLSVHDLAEWCSDCQTTKRKCASRHA